MMAGPGKARIVIVVARAENGVIGKDGTLPWRLSSDLKHFRAVTMGKPVIMGRKTFQSIGKPLEGRDNIVVTRNPDFAAEGVIAAASLEEALDVARMKAGAREGGEIAIIGGAEIYAAAMTFTDVIDLTEVHARPDGDTFMPDLDGNVWTETSRQRHAAGPKDSADYSFVRLERSS